MEVYNHWNIICYCEGYCPQIVLVYQAISYYQIAIHFVLYVDGDRRHIAVLLDHTWLSIR
jgi:hypothetical protein